MKLDGTQKFSAPSTEVYSAILNPEVLKACLPGIESISYSTPTRLELEATISLPLPGLNDVSFGFGIDITKQQAPNLVEFAVSHKGKRGSLETTCQISLANEGNGSVLKYEGQAVLGGFVAVADNFVGQNAAKGKLSEFFKNLEKEVAKAHV